MSKIKKNSTLEDYLNKYIEMWKYPCQASKLAYTLKVCTDQKFDKLIFLLQNNTRPTTSSLGSQRSWIYGIEANDWEKDFEPMIMYQTINLSSLRVKNTP